MKFSFMSFSCPKLDLDLALQTAVQYKYDGFEPRIDSGHMHGIEINSSNRFIQEAKHKAADNGISICCIASSCSFSNPDTAEKNIEDCKRVLELANRVGAPAIRVFGGTIPDACSREQSFETIVQALNELSDRARQSNVNICLETHDSWCNPEHVSQIIKAVNSNYVSVNWDIMHPVLTAGFSVQDSFEILQHNIKHVHIHDGLKTANVLEFKPVGEGKVDHRTALKLLLKNGYDGYVSGEWINWEPYDIHLPREISTLKNYILKMTE